MVTTITLNASIDKAYHMEQPLQNGTVMRVGQVHNSAGGKGLNVARAVKKCGEAVLASGLAGGYNGKYLQELLDQDGIPQLFVTIEGETRSCINILDPGYGSTEYLEPGCGISADEEANFLKHFPGLIANSDVVTLSGSIPVGMSQSIYYDLIAICHQMDKLVILDTSGALLENGIKAHPTMIKPNKEELELLFQSRIENQEQLLACAKELQNQGIPYVLVSLGGEGSLLACREGIFQAKPPKLIAINTVGCGDSMVGAFAAALSRRQKPEEALRYASAVASANAVSKETGNFESSVMESIYQDTQVIVLEDNRNLRKESE